MRYFLSFTFIIINSYSFFLKKDCSSSSILDSIIIPEMVFVEGDIFMIDTSILLEDYFISKYEVKTIEFIEFLNDISEDLFINQKEEVFYKGQLIYKVKCYFDGDDCLGEDFIFLIENKSTRMFKVHSGYENYPVNLVSWYGALMYCDWLSNNTNNIYKLPTDIEWYFAAMGGKLSNKTEYSGSNNINEVGWCDDSTFLYMPKEVGKKKPNELGIYDMSGNLWEWCEKSLLCEEEKLINNKILKGGSFFQPCDSSKISSKILRHPSFCARVFGFRVVMKPKVT